MARRPARAQKLEHTGRYHVLQQIKVVPPGEEVPRLIKPGGDPIELREDDVVAFQKRDKDGIIEPELVAAGNRDE